MAVEVGEQVCVVWDDAACVQDSVFGSAQRVSAASAVFWISVDIRIGFSPEFLGVVFGAQAVFHARAEREVCVELPAWDREEGMCGLLQTSLYGARDVADCCPASGLDISYLPSAE